MSRVESQRPDPHFAVRFEGKQQDSSVVRLDMSQADLGTRVEAIRKRLAGGPHWYLIAHGMQQSKQEGSFTPTLLEPVLSKADGQGLPCYLETFCERNVPFYEACGFRVQGAGRFPRGGPNFWAMMRAPQ